MNNRFTPQAKKVLDLIDAAEVGLIQLPTFQRGYNWTTSAVLYLLDSIHKGHPAGSLLFLETDENLSRIAFERIRSLPIEAPVTHPKYLVLDGQQRLTSCHTVYFNRGKSTFFIDLNQLHLNYNQDYEELDLVDQRIIIAKKNEANPILTLQRLDLLPFPLLRDKIRFRKVIYEYKESLRNLGSTQKAYLDFLEENLENFVEPFLNYEFPVVSLPPKLSIEAVCKVFQSINTTGLKLSAFDICVATFMPDGIDLREKLQVAKLDEPNLDRIIEADPTIFLQTIALLAKKSPKGNALPKNLESTHISGYWNQAVSGLIKVIDLYKRLGFDLAAYPEQIPYQPILPVSAAVLSSIEFDKNFESKIDEIGLVLGRWVFKCALESRYNEGTDNKMVEDFDMLMAWVREGTIPKALFYQINLNVEKVILSSKNSAIGKAIIALINMRNVVDLLAKEIPAANHSEKSQLQLAQIYTNKESKDNPRHLNSIFNFTYLEQQTINKIRKAQSPKFFEEYLDEETSFEINSKMQLLGEHFITKTCVDNIIRHELEQFLKERGRHFLAFLKDKFELNIKVSTLENTEIDPDENFFS